MTEKHRNGAKMREALEVAQETADELLKWCSNHYQELNCMGGHLKRAIEGALSEPARVCDVLSSNELKLQVFAGLAYQIKIKGFNIRGLEELLKSVAGAVIDIAYGTNEEGKTND